MNLEDRKWKEFKFIDIFNIKCGFYNKKPNSEKNGKIPFIGATEYNNGITEFYSYENILNTSKTGKEPNESIERKIFPGNCLCVTNNGSVGFAYYQKIPFTCTHDVNPLYLKDYKLNKYIAMFLIATIEKQRVCFMYARKWRPCRMVKSKLLLPLNSKAEPDYKFMEEYIKEREAKLKNHYKEYIQKHIDKLQKKADIKNKKWGNFKLSKIFSFDKGNQNNMGALQNGDIPLVSAKKVDNGYKNFVSKNNKKIFNGGCISLNNDGDGGAGIAYYQPYKMLLDSHCTALVSKLKLTKETLLFLSKSITKQRRKFGHGYAINKERLKAFQIMLPINSKGEPDYEFMHNYMLYLEQKKILEYLEYIDG